MIAALNHFGKHVNLNYWSNKNSNIQENIILVEKGKLQSKQKDVASTFYKHFRPITDSLSLFSSPEDTPV